jgi:hypothetical protein
MVPFEIFCFLQETQQFMMFINMYMYYLVSILFQGDHTMIDICT